MWFIQLFSFLLLLTSTRASVSEAEFTTAIKNSGYGTPSTKVYRNFNDATSGFSKEETAMLLAQLVHESSGFRYVEEIGIKSEHNCIIKVNHNNLMSLFAALTYLFLINF